MIKYICYIILLVLVQPGFFIKSGLYFCYMVIVYPLQHQNDYTELRYSLRSLEKYFTGSYEVVVVGDKIPDWLTGVTQIVIPDITGRKQLTIKKKTYAGIVYAKGPILQMNDDVYLLKQTDGYSYPCYYNKTLNYVGESGAKPLMAQLMIMKLNIKNFDLHQPILYEEKFKDAFEKFPSDVIVKSCYSNYFCIEGVGCIDFKCNKKMDQLAIEQSITGKDYFSTGPVGLPFAMPVLEKLFPKKSIFEI